jgi:hypothetical protein
LGGTFSLDCTDTLREENLSLLKESQMNSTSNIVSSAVTTERSAVGDHELGGVAARHTSFARGAHSDHAVTHGAHAAHAAHAVSSWPGLTELSQLVSAHGTGLLVALAVGAAALVLVMALARAAFGCYLRTDRASWGILDNGLTLAGFAVGGLALAAFVAPSTGVGVPLLRGLLSLAGAHLGPVGGAS